MFRCSETTIVRIFLPADIRQLQLYDMFWDDCTPIPEPTGSCRQELKRLLPLRKYRVKERY